MSSKFPWRKFTDEKLDQQYERLRSESLKRRLNLTLRASFIGAPCSNAFFQYVRMSTPGGGKLSPVEAWKDPKHRAHINRFVGKMGIYPAMGLFMPMMCKQFPPMWAAQIYRYFKANHIFDPYAGWGDRCVAAMTLGIPYTGVDSNPKLRYPYKDMIDFFNPKPKPKIRIAKSENVNIESIPFDVVLTSPPFWDKKGSKDKKGGKKVIMVEEYKNSENNYEKFMKNSLIPVTKRCLKKARWVCLHVPPLMYKDLSKVIGKSTKRFTIDRHKGFNSFNRHKPTEKRYIYCWKGKGR